MDPNSVALPELITRLASPSQQEREQAARELFRRGCANAEPVLRTWFADPEFRALVRAGGPLLTVGIAVAPAHFNQIRAAFGNPRVAEAPSDQDVIEFELEFAHGVRIDVLTTSDPAGAGAIARFLARAGEGIQQIECEVRDVTRATQLLRTHFALEPVYPESRAGADGSRVNFFLVPVAPDAKEDATQSRKVLIELVETAPRPRPPKSRR